MGANTIGRANVLALTNKSGGAVAAGDVVIVDSANNDAFTTTTTGSYIGALGVVLSATIANNATGLVVLNGYVALVNVNASVTRGHFGATYTVAKQATDAGVSRGTGTFCQFLTGGTTPDAMIWQPDLGGAGVSVTTKGDLQGYSTAAARIPVGTNGQVLTADSTQALGLKWATGAADTVQVASGAGSVVIPGLKADADAVPGSPNAADDEFNALSGWTTVGTLDTLNVTDFPSLVHMKRANVAVHADGIIKACPTIPFTVTVKLVDALLDRNYNTQGIVLGEAAPGKLLTFGPIFNNGWPGYVLNNWTNVSTLGAATNSSFINPTFFHYLRAVVHSSTNIDFEASWNGLVWFAAPSLTAFNPGFTVGSVGVGMSDSSAATTNEACFDWIRFA